MKIRYDKYDNAEQECPNTQWGRYLLYLMLWVLDHQDNHYDEEQSDYDEIVWKGVKI